MKGYRFCAYQRESFHKGESYVDYQRARGVGIRIDGCRVAVASQSLDERIRRAVAVNSAAANHFLDSLEI